MAHTSSPLAALFARAAEYALDQAGQERAGAATQVDPVRVAYAERLAGEAERDANALAALFVAAEGWDAKALRSAAAAIDVTGYAPPTFETEPLRQACARLLRALANAGEGQT